MKIYIYIAISLMFILFGISYYSLTVQNEKLTNENNRKTENINTLNSTLKVFKTADSLNAAKISSLTYTADEFRTFRAQDMQTIKSLKMMLKNVNSVTNIETVTKDSLIVNIVYKDSTKCFDYKDEFMSLNGCINDSTVNINYKHTEKLTAVVSTTYKHKFLWWSWGFKVQDLTVKSKNPNTNIDKIEYIIVKK